MDEKKFHTLVDSSFNLLTASQMSQEHLEQLTKELSHQSNILRRTAESIHSEAAQASKKSVKDITEQILGDFKVARDEARAASSEFRTARKSSFLMFSVIVFFPWLILISFGCWLHYTGKIPTVDNIQRLLQEHAMLSEKIEGIKQEYDIRSCDGRPCVRVDTRRPYGDAPQHYYVIVSEQ
ncbi:hypothetical protein [Arsukibacterium sp.]|uniref:hypothetical protein n=1 Tax=Arsukibacterium sp. TaxID=1977258 RepID=UPI00299D0C2B|nr:hypothetical protein [Arsukibacterium sp.]MDX1539586.1 hypothetical protein [Arsukibacterium sp.]